MKTQSIYFLFFMFLSCGVPRSTESEISDGTNSDESSVVEFNKIENYTLLGQSRSGTYKSFDFLSEKYEENDARILVDLKLLKVKYCNNDCNTITLWKSREGYNLYTESRQNENDEKPRWKRKHWAKMCESMAATYYATIEEVIFYPFFDDKYRNYGGKLSKKSGRYQF